MPVRLAACAAVLLFPLAAPAQVPYDANRAYSQCAGNAARSAGPAPRANPRPGDDLAAMARQRQDYEDRYYRALDQCLRDADRRRTRR